MAGVFERLQDFATWAAKGKIALPEVAVIPPEQCLPPGSAGANIEKDRDYISISINDLLLAEARNFWNTYSPMVLVNTGFVYDGKRITVPAVIGPNLLSQAGQKLPQGIVLHDTTVAGPYPYRGGSVAISMVLYRVRQKDYAHGLLQLVEGVASAIGASADMGLLSKVGGTLIEGLETFLGLGETEPLAGHRIELSSLKPSGFRTSFSALIAGASGLDIRNLRVVEGRLRVAADDGELRPCDAADYVLYSVTASRTRQDESTLPFYSLYKRALENAARGDDASWEWSHASLMELGQQVVLSPDLTREQARELLKAWQSELVEQHELAKKRRMMSLDAQPGTDERLAEAAAILHLES